MHEIVLGHALTMKGLHKVLMSDFHLSELKRSMEVKLDQLMTVASEDLTGVQREFINPTTQI